MLIINFEDREAKGLSKGRYDETFAGEDDSQRETVIVMSLPWQRPVKDFASRSMFLSLGKMKNYTF